MAKMDICTAMVRINDRTTVFRSEHRPLTYPEVDFLTAELGDRAVYDVKVIDTVDADKADVLTMLRLRYGTDRVKEAFPGSRPNLPMTAPPEIVRVGAAKAPAKRRTRKAKVAPEPAPAPEEDLADVLAGGEPNQESEVTAE